MKKFYIDGIEIGGENVVVIPEIGINHGGDLSVAKEMVLSAKNEGARIIKHQTHICDSEMDISAKHVLPGNSDKSIYEIISNCALSEKEENELKNYTESLGLVFLSTPFSKKAVDRLEKMDVKAYKIGSGELNNIPLIKYIISTKKPIILSTGMHDLNTIRNIVGLIEAEKIPYTLLHTTSLYPTKSNQVRICAMQEMMKEFPDVCIGLSDHTVNNLSSYVAIAYGAKIIERHYTDTYERKGPDIACSMDRNNLRELIYAAEEIPKMLNGTKAMIREEEITRDFAFAAIYSSQNIKKGQKLTEYNICTKRPFVGGVSAIKYEGFLGKQALFDIKKNSKITHEMIE